MKQNIAKIVLNRLFILFASLFVLSGCGGGGASGANVVTTDPVIGAKLTISITNDQNQQVSTAQATDTVNLSVVATNDFGRTVSGVAVTFTSDLGTLSTGSALTDSTGKATVRLITTASDLGVSAIITTATVDSKALTASGQIEITELTATASTLTLDIMDQNCELELTSVPAGTKLCLRANLSGDGSPSVGAIVNFQSTLGTLEPTSKLTDANGDAIVFLASTTDLLGASTVTIDTASLTTSKNFEYTAFEPQPAPDPVITLEVLDANCINPVTTTAASSSLCLKATLTQDETPIETAIVTFGAGVGTLRDTATLTDADGVAFTYIDSGNTTTGASTATATYDVASASQNYQFTENTATTTLSMVIFDADCSTPLSSVSAGLSLCLKANLIHNNQPVSDALITFNASLGTLRQTTVLTNSIGVATIFLDSTTDLLGAATATATYDLLSVSKNYQFTVATGAGSTNLSLTMLDSTCSTQTNRVSAGVKLCLQATLFKNNQPLANEIINFETTLGVLRQSSALTNASGIVTVMLDSSTDLLGAGVVTASITGITDTQNFEYTASTPSGIIDLTVVILDENCNAEVTSTPGGTVVCLRANLTRDNLPISNAIINFASTLGTVRQITGLTGADGFADIFLDSTNNTLGAAVVTATYEQLPATQNFEYTNGIPVDSSLLLLSIMDESCTTQVTTVAAGTPLCLQATLTKDDAAITNALVNFAATLGTLQKTSSLTNDEGIATVILDSTSNLLGGAVATATYEQLTANENYEFSNGITTTLSLSVLDNNCNALASSVPAGSTLCLQASLIKDNQPLSGMIINMATTLGTLRKTSALTNSAGVITILMDTTTDLLGAGIVTATFEQFNTSENFELIEGIPGGGTILSLNVLEETCSTQSISTMAGNTLCLRAQLTKDNQPIINAIINFSSSLGTLRQSTGLTDADGLTTILLDSTTTVLGAAVASASYEQSTASENFEYTEFIPQPSQDPVVTLIMLDATLCKDEISSVVAGNSFCLTVQLTQQGDPIAGEIITFAAPLGTLRQTTILTDNNGQVTTYLDSINSITGAATLTASFGNFSDAKNYEFTPLPAGNGANLTLSVQDDSCTSKLSSTLAGSSLCLEVSLIRDNAPLADAIINFVAGLGTLRQTTALTNELGSAFVILDSLNTELGAAIATASFETITDSQNYQFAESPSENDLSLALELRNATCTSLTSSAAVGDDLCLQAKLTKANLPLSGELITFSAPIGTLEQTTKLTDTDGFAAVLVNSATTDLGAATATATYGQFTKAVNYEFTKGNTGQDTSLTLKVLEATCTTEVTAAVAGIQLCIEATLSRVGSDDEGEIIDFTATLGELTPATALTDSAGVATTLITSGPTLLGAATVTASYQGLAVSKNYELITEQSSRTLTLSVRESACVTETASFQAGSSLCLAAQLLDSGEPVSGEVVAFTTPLGTLRQESALTNAGGFAVAYVDSTAVVLGAATATATNANLIANANYEFISDTNTSEQGPQLVLGTVEGTSSFNVGSSIQLQATLLNDDNTPIIGSIARFTAERGILSTDSALTGADGKASVSLSAEAIHLGAAVATAQVTVNSITYTQSFNYEILASDNVGDVVRIGHFDASNTFIEGIIGTNITPEPASTDVIEISAGGSVGLTINVVDENDIRITNPTTVTFTSACSTNGNANLDTSVSTINGEANSTYEDVSCATAGGNQDILVASITVSNVALSASRTIKLLPEDAGSIEFISADPTSIVLSGTGGQGKQETSTLTFSVKGELGNPLSQQVVDFALDSGAGDLSISPTSATTNSQGLVSTRVTSGNIPTSVRVTASTKVGTADDAPVIRTQSDLLSVNTGLPDQNSITLSTDTFNPETDALTGQTVFIRAYMADAFNNPVPDGTTVNFTTEGGFIQPSCNTLNGNCNVLWTATNPRVDNHRITITATAIGHETFFDVNGDNVFDDGDGVAITQAGTDSGLFRGDYASSGFVDHSEAWRDDNENLAHDSGEVFIDYNNDKAFTAADGKFNGPQCTHATLCATDQKGMVRKSLVMIMSGSTIKHTVMTAARTTTTNGGIIHINNNHVITTTQNGVQPEGGLSVTSTGATTELGVNDVSITLEEDQSIELILTISDDAAGLGQILPSSTSFSVVNTVGRLSGTISSFVPNSLGAFDGSGNDIYGGTSFTFTLINTNTVASGGDEDQVGIITFTFQLPTSLATSSFTIPVTMIGR